MLCVEVLFVVLLLAEIRRLVRTAKLTFHLPQPSCTRTG